MIEKIVRVTKLQCTVTSQFNKMLFFFLSNIVHACFRWKPVFGTSAGKTD